MAAVVAGKALATLLGLLTLATLARHLGAEGLGQYRTVLTVVAFCGVAGDLGVYTVTLRQLSGWPRESGSILGTALALRLAATTIAIGAITSLIWILETAPAVRLGLLIAGFGWIAYQGSELLIAAFQVKLRQDLAALAGALAAAVTFGGVVVVAWAGGGVPGMLGAASAGFLAGFAASLALLRRLGPSKLRVDRAAWPAMIRAGLPIAISSALVMAHARGDVAILALTRPSLEVGLYDIGLKIHEIAATIAYLFGGLILPLLTQDIASGGRQFQNRLAGALAATLAVGAGALALLYVFAEPVSVLFAGSEFAASAGPLRILTLSMGIAALAFACRFAALALRRQRAMLTVDAVAVAAALIAYTWLIPRWSTHGAAIGRVVGDLLMLVGAAWVAGAGPAVRSCLRPSCEIVLAVLALIAGLWLMERIGLPWPLAAVLGAGLYLAVLWPAQGLRRSLAQLAAEPSDAQRSRPLAPGG